MPSHEKLNYVELAARDLDATERFFKAVFGWEFTSYGPDYSAFSNAGLDGGFYRAPLASTIAQGAALLVFYSDNLATTQAKIVDNGGTINKATFSFPGGHRFHFLEPSGNEFAVWSETL